MIQRYGINISGRDVILVDENSEYKYDNMTIDRQGGGQGDYTA